MEDSMQASSRGAPFLSCHLLLFPGHSNSRILVYVKGQLLSISPLLFSPHLHKLLGDFRGLQCHWILNDFWNRTESVDFGNPLMVLEIT